MIHLQARSSLGALLAVTVAAAGCSRSHDDQPTRYDSSAATSASPSANPAVATTTGAMPAPAGSTAVKGAAFDTSFVNGEIIDHKHDIEDAHRMATAAQQPRVKSLVESSLPVLQKHLERAQQIANQPAK